MMKNFFKKLNKDQNVENDDLNLDYGDFYMGKEAGPAERPMERGADRSADRAADHSAGGYYDVPKTTRGGYEEPDFRSDNSRYYEGDRPAERVAERVVERPAERPAERIEDRDESFVKPRETWQESDAPGYRPAPTSEPEPESKPVFTPAPAPEYLYFTPSTYRDCREGIVKGLSSGHVVVVRLRSLEANDVLRLFDYMMGAVLALDAELVRPAATTVVLVPKGVELDEDELEPDDEDEDEDEYEDDEYDEDEYNEEDGYEDGEYGAYEDEDEYEDDDSAYEDEDAYEDDEYDDDEYDDDGYDEEDSDEDAR